MNKLIANMCVMITLLVIISLSGSLMAQEAKIEIVPMSPLLQSELGLGSEFFPSTGLQNVGKGEHIYIRAADRDGGDIINYTWEFISIPDGSAAVITELPAGEDIYYFVADVIGQYDVKLTITTADGTDETERIFSANMYMGAGGVGGVGPIFPQCGTCHYPIQQDWVTTDHATIFQRGVDGEVPGFGPGRQRTATTGMATVDLENNSYFSLKASTGWEFPATPAPGTFDALVSDHPQLAQRATVGCESCHGAGSLHTNTENVYDRNLMQVSYTSESCQSCHDAPRVTAQFHSFRRSGHIDPVWSNSFQNREWTNDLQYCARCHDGKAYVYFVKGGGPGAENPPFDTDPEVFNPNTHVGVTCETCHEPHQGGVRKAPASSDTLAGGFNYASINLGAGATCGDCHKYRQDGYNMVTNVPITNVRWGPHYAGAIDVLLGEGGYEFYTETPKSFAHRNMENTCASCHMATAEGEFRNLLGDHSFNMRYTDNGAERDLIEACQNCHAGISSFADILGADYNNTGVQQPFQEEVADLLHMLAMALPPYGEPTINWQEIDNDDPDMKGAYWNYRYVYYDRSLGVHNPKYVVALLQRSITQMTGIEFENRPDMPMEYTLTQNYPNPFNPTTQIQFSIPEYSNVTLTVYDITGREVTKLVNESLGTGTYTVTWDGRNANGQIVSSGVYIYRIQAGSFVQSKRMVFVK